LQTTAAIIAIPAPWKPVLYKLAHRRGKPTIHKLAQQSKWNNETDTQAIFVECSAPLFDKERFDFHCYPSTVEAGAI
jgi:hypothetical protein